MSADHSTTLAAGGEEPFWMNVLRSMARNPLYANEQALPLVNAATWSAIAFYIDTLTAYLADAERERDEARQQSAAGREG